jgi:hypothetical protein
MSVASCGGDSSSETTDADSASEESVVEVSPSSDSVVDDSVTVETDGEESAASGNPGAETLVDGPAAADKTVTWDGSGWSPGSLEVAVGEVFSFVTSAGAGVAAVSFNGADSYTITSGLIESFTLDTPGTYTVIEFISGTAMTVTVTG